MFAKSLSKLSIFALALSLPLQALGHAGIEPAIGVSGASARSDVQRPSKNSPCGNVNVASALADSTPVQATNGAFTVTVQNFNAGADGSTSIKSTSVDPTGTGKTFTGGAVTITKNGNANPPSTGSVQVSGTLPAGTTCTGGADGVSCLVSFTTSAGFGNCVLISQGGGAGAAAGGAAATPASAAPAAESSTPAKKKAKGGKTKKCAEQPGTRAARSVKARKEAGEFARRDGQSWVWAA